MLLERLMKSKMNILDISWPITPSTTQYKNRNEIHIEQTKRFEVDGVRASVVTLGCHVGTHVDAPSHFLKDGKSIEHYQLEQLIGPCVVLDLTHVKEAITVQDLEHHEIQANLIVLLKTKNSFLTHDAAYDPNFVYLEKSGAQFLVEKKIKAVGIDYLGIERNQSQHETHSALLGANIPIIEGLRLAQVLPGSYFFCCLPLAIHEAEAAPARAVLWT